MSELFTDTLEKTALDFAKVRLPGRAQKNEQRREIATVKTKIFGLLAVGLLAVTASSPGVAVAVPIPTVTTVSSSGSPSLSGGAVTLTSTTTANANAVTSGTINWYQRHESESVSTSLGAYALNSSGQTSFSLSNLLLGWTTFTAVFSGNEMFLGSSGSILHRVIEPPPPPQPGPLTITLLSSSANPSFAGDLVTFTSRTTDAVNGLSYSDLTGLVTFAVYFNQQVFQTFVTSVTADGFAYFSTSALPVGYSSVNASYGGDAKRIGSSGSLLQRVLPAATVPEPGSLALLGLGLAGLGLSRRRKAA